MPVSKTAGHTPDWGVNVPTSPVPAGSARLPDGGSEAYIVVVVAVAQWSNGAAAGRWSTSEEAIRPHGRRLGDGRRADCSEGRGIPTGAAV